MRYLVVLILACAAAWYFFMRTEPEKPKETQVVHVDTPAEQFQKLLSGKVDAAVLARLCQAYPQLAVQFLRNRSLPLTGTIEDFRLAGMDGRRADVYLHTNSKLRVVVSFDLDRYARLSVSEREAGRYTCLDTELLWVTINGTDKRRIFMKEQPLGQQAVFQSLGATNINFSAVTP